MPAYDFKCIDCDSIVELIRPVGEAVAEPCPECGGTTKRIFSPVGVVFKGSGFHNTDYKPRPKEDSSATSKSCEKKTDSSACASCPAAGSDT